ncbi:MAG: phosphate signaling complex protein PhoU [Steroidobacteraceae bacterium]
MEQGDYGHHIVSRYNEELERLRSEVLHMGGMVEEQLRTALAALAAGDAFLSDEVVRAEYLVNLMEVSIDADCNRILATRAPTASDLRLVLSILKLITDLERIGDEARKIGQISARSIGISRMADRQRIVRHLGEAVRDLLHESLDCFARRDAAAALEAVKRDRLIDEEYDAIQRQSMTFMIEDPRTIRAAIDLMWMARALERIGDHSKNICEYVVYMVHGRDVRHSTPEDAERELGAEPGRPGALPGTTAPAAAGTSTS